MSVLSSFLKMVHSKLDVELDEVNFRWSFIFGALHHHLSNGYSTTQVAKHMVENEKVNWKTWGKKLGWGWFWVDGGVYYGQSLSCGICHASKTYLVIKTHIFTSYKINIREVLLLKLVSKCSNTFQLINNLKQFCLFQLKHCNFFHFS